MYAGFPSGNKLVEFIYDSLTPSEKKIIQPNLSLSDLTEEYGRIKKSRNPLIRLLKQRIEQHVPLSTKYHDLITTIPHFKTIITTNYDSLFEDSFGTQAQVILSNRDIPYLENNKVHIFKVHGDFRELDRIIISKSDYTNFFNKEKDSLYWTVVTERVSTKNVLFLGYNLEDSNITSLFDKIYDNLEQHTKEAFLVAPNLPQHKVNDLVRKGIHYIDSTAEELIDELIFSLKETILGDLDKKYVSPETFRKFLDLNGLISKIKSSGDGFELESLEGKQGFYEGKMDLKLNNNNSFFQNFNQFIQGNRNLEFTISKDNIINTKITLQGLKHPSSDDIVKIHIKKRPSLDEPIDIVFKNGDEFSNIPLKIFPGKECVILSELHKALFEFILNPTEAPKIKISFNFSDNIEFSKTKDGIEVYKLLHNLSKGEIFSVFLNDGTKYTHNLPYLDQYYDLSKQNLNYFESLKTIETFYSIRFTNIVVTEESFLSLNKVSNIINKKWQTINRNIDLRIDLSSLNNEQKEAILELENQEREVFYPGENYEYIELHNHTLNIGKPIFIITDPYIENLERIKSKQDSMAIIKSRDNQLKVVYSLDKE